MQRSLRIAIERGASTAAIFDGSVPAPRGVRAEAVDAKPFNATFKRMVRGLEFDVCELGITTYFLAKAHGCPITALPVFPAGSYPHSGFECVRTGGVASPADLSGSRVGLRSFAAPSAVWARGALARQFGVDPATVTWVVSGEEIVPGIRLPANVERVAGADLRSLLSDGAIDAGIGLAAQTVGGNVHPMWPDAGPVEREFAALIGGPPLNHVLVIKEDLPDGLAGELVSWFAAATGLTTGITEAERASLRTLLELTRQQLPDETGLASRVEDAFAVVTPRHIEERI
jgi:4,5-dihydroxyphthalate decarboxylase